MTQMVDEIPKPNDPTKIEDASGWMSDVQRALALILIGSFAFVTVFSTVCSLFWPNNIALIDMAKSLQSNLTNMCLIGLGFFFGNTMAKMAQDAGQQKVVEKLTSTAPPTGGPVAPLSAPITVASWWSLLDVNEQTVIENAAKAVPPDVRVQAALAAFKSGTADLSDLKALVDKGLLTQARSDQIKPPKQGA